MTVLHRVVVVAGYVAFVTVAASCGRSPTSPARPVDTPPNPAAVSAVRINIEAPSSIEPDVAVQLRATATRSDGSSEDVTAQAEWSTSDPRVLQVAAGGVATARARGEAVVVVRHSARSASTRVVVLRNGTFRLDGLVSDDGLPLAGARIEVISGTGEGLVALSNASGAYALYGVAGGVRLHIKKEGYRNQTRELNVTGHSSLSVEMTLEQDRPRLAGTYTLEIEAGPCANGARLPDAARIRTYTAIVEQTGPRLNVRLSDAELIVNDGKGDRFSGTFEGDSKVKFGLAGEFRYYYYYYEPVHAFGIAERLSASSALLVFGSVTAEAVDSHIDGSLDGFLLIVNDVVPPFIGDAVFCWSGAHRFTMRRSGP
jgi:hypothetical protein